VAGEYQFNRRSYTTFQKVIGLTGAIRVAPDTTEAITVHSPLGDMRLVPVAPLLYREELGQGLVSFRADSAGRVTHGFLGIAPMMALERVPWYESPTLHLVILGLAVAVFLVLLVAAIVRLVRRLRGRAVRRDDAAARGRRGGPLPGRGLLVTLALVNLAFVVALIVLASNAETAVLSGPATGLKAALVLPVLGALLALAAAVMAVMQWRHGAGSAGARLRYSAVVVVALLFAWSLNTWNLLGWRM
jgi:hypothetical protein